MMITTHPAKYMVIFRINYVLHINTDFSTPIWVFIFFSIYNIIDYITPIHLFHVSAET